MSASGKRLGRGLSSLLGDYAEAAPATDGEDASAAPQSLPIHRIRPNAEQPRKSFDVDELAALTDSIRERGVLQPLIVRPLEGGDYQLVAGERRWRAAQNAGLHDVPVRVMDLDERATMEAAIIENVQRQDLNPLEEAAAYQAMLDAFGHTQESLAKVIGKSRSHVANLLRLLNLSAPIQAHVRDGRLSMGHARALLSARDPEKLAAQAIEKGLSVRDVERLAADGDGAGRKIPTGGAKRPSDEDPDRVSLENDLAAALGMDVTLKDRNGRGEVAIAFTSYEQLDELCGRLFGALNRSSAGASRS